MVRTKLTKSADSLHLCMQFFAGHGMQKDGLQVIVVNEFDPYGNFYKPYRAEQRIRYCSEHFNNCYFIGIFACCREIFKALKHANCISKEEHEKKIQQEKAENELQEKNAGEQTKHDDQELSDQEGPTAYILVEKNGVTVRVKADKNAEGAITEAGRGDGNLEIPMPSNFLLVFGAKPGNVVSVDTQLIQEVMGQFEKFYDKRNLTAIFPGVIERLQGSDTNIEIV